MDEIVTLHHREAITTSLKVAEVFGKRHKDVLRAIEGVSCSEGFTRRNFRPSEYTDSTGRKLPMYEITRDGFSFLAMGFTGKNAAVFKEKYIDAFNRMEQALLNQQNLSWQQARLEGKTVRRELTDAVSEFVEYATNQGSLNARRYYQNITKMTYSALFLVKEASSKPFRDLLDGMQITFLSTAEYVARQSLIDGMNQGLPYRDIYNLTRERVTTYAATLPRQRLIA